MKKLVFMMLLIFCTACGNEVVNNYDENKNFEKVKGIMEQEDEKQIIDVEENIFKDGRFVEFDNDYKIPVAEEECVFINSIIPNGEDFLVKATIYEKFTLSEEELKEKMEKNDEICIDGNLYKVVKLNNEYCLKTDVDDNYVRLNSQGNPFIIDKTDIDFFAYKITDKKVEFLLDSEACLSGNQFIAQIKDIDDMWWTENEANTPAEDQLITFEHGIYHTFFDREIGKCVELTSYWIRG